jgi:hypothetical protein
VAERRLDETRQQLAAAEGADLEAIQGSYKTSSWVRAADPGFWPLRLAGLCSRRPAGRSWHS